MAGPRRLRLVLLGAATLLLALASWVAVSGVSALNQAKVRASQNRVELAQLRGLVPALVQREQFVHEQEELKQLVAQTGIDPANWTDRRVQRSPGALTRREAEQLLSQYATGNAAQWFAADRFDVAVTSLSDGLFTPAGPDEKGFNLEMMGTVYFPLSAK